MSSDKHSWDDQIDMTYEQEFKWRFGVWVYLVREMEKQVGKEKAHNIVRQAGDNFQTDRYKNIFANRKPIESFQEYLEYSKETRNSPMMSKTRTTSNLVETSE